MTIKASECFKKFGDPKKESSMAVFNVPKRLSAGALPEKVYCNKLLLKPLESAFTNIVDRGLVSQVITWDGCFNIRKSKAAGDSWSVHAWGFGIDINRATNDYGHKPQMSKELVACFTDAGFEWGGNWKTPDGMHFQLAKF